MSIGMSDAEKARFESRMHTALMAGNKAKREALKDPVVWAEQIVQSVLMAFKTLAIALVLTSIAGALIDDTGRIIQVGCIAALLAFPFLKWPNIFKDRFMQAYENSMSG